MLQATPVCVHVCACVWRARVCMRLHAHLRVYASPPRPPPRAPPQEPEAHTCQCTLRGSERVKCDSVLARIPNS